LIVWFIQNKTVYGKSIYAVGGNREAAKVAGVKVDKIIISAFVIESVLVGIAGILEVARTGSANSAYGNAYDFDAISACVVGGVSLSGGIGKVSGACIGVLIFTIISYGLTFISVNPNWQLIIKGMIICAAVALDMRKNIAKV
jgi:methyl-galactoside transport system permease protein